MNTPLSVLMLEDRDEDARIMLQELRRAGYAPKGRRVDCESDFRAALDPSVELILADFHIPGWDTLEALAITQASQLEIPFIIVSGSIGEEAAVDAMRAGAGDYLFKDRLARLGPAVQQALEQTRLRAERRQLESDQAAERERASALLLESQQRLALATKAAHIGVWDWDIGADRILLDEQTYAIYGVRALEFGGAYATWRNSVHRQDRARCDAEVDAALAGQDQFHSEFRVVWPGGSVRDVESFGRVHRGADGAATRMLGVTWDITERKSQARRIARLSRMRSMLLAISSALLRLRERDSILSEACRIAVVEGRFANALARLVDPATGEMKAVASAGGDARLIEEIEIAATLDPRHSEWPGSRAVRERRIAVSNDIALDPALSAISARLLEAGVRAVAACPLLVDGVAVAVFMLGADAVGFFDDEEVRLLDAFSADLSFALDRIAKAQRLDYLAYYDVLTGLPNATLFRDRLEQFLAVARVAGEQVCVLALHLERFTVLNDALGRRTGDALLRLVGERLAAELEPPYCLAHGAAGSFTIAKACAGDDAEAVLCQRLRAALSRPFQVDEQQIQLTAQAGIAVFPVDGEDSETLVRNAELALEQTKAAGTRHTYYSRAMNDRAAARLALESELASALEQRQFVLDYQPRVDLISGELVGAEALIRWQHPRRGLLAPAAFIGLAEETGLIEPIGDWVIASVCAQQAAWSAALVPLVPVAVNLSPLQFQQGDLLAKVSAQLRACQLDARLLDLELTESAVMHDPLQAAQVLRELRRLGVGLALDDFGTGYSSLAHLKRFPFSTIKLDRAFVIDITHDPEDAAIATAIIAMAHQLGMKVVAEGVETEGQMRYLRAQRCDELQGNYFSPPMDAGAFEAFLRAGKRLQLPAAAPQEVRTVLVVDDDAHIRSALNRELRRDGYRVLLAASGPDALELLAVNDVQVIISDQRMTPMPGIEFLSIVSKLYPDTQRIILSGYTDLAVVTEAVNRGSAFKFVTKPWAEEALRDQVRDAFSRYRRSATQAARESQDRPA